MVKLVLHIIYVTLCVYSNWRAADEVVDSDEDAGSTRASQTNNNKPVSSSLTKQKETVTKKDTDKETLTQSSSEAADNDEIPDFKANEDAPLIDISREIDTPAIPPLLPPPPGANLQPVSMTANAQQSSRDMPQTNGSETETSDIRVQETAAEPGAYASGPAQNSGEDL